MTNAHGTFATDAPDDRLWVRWFVQYNPLFTLSALFVLVGVFVSQRALGAGSAVLLTGVVEVYQWLLIGTAAVLYRRLHEHRPGVILGVIALVFLIDPTLQQSGLVAYAVDHDIAAVAAFGAVFFTVGVAAKLSALAWAFCLRLSTTARVLPVLLAATVSALPSLRVFGDVNAAIVVAVGIFVVGLVFSLAPPEVRSLRALGPVGQRMLPRLLRAAVAVAVVGAVLQGQNALLAVGPKAMLVVASSLSFVFSVMSHRSLQALVTSLVFGLVLACAGDTGALGMGMALTTLIVASFTHGLPLQIATALFAGLPAAYGRALGLDMSLADGANVVIVLVATVAIVVVAVHAQRRSALLAALTLYGVPATSFAKGVVPVLMGFSGGTYGALLVVAGFVLLPAGVVVHRRLSKLVGDVDGHVDAHVDEANSNDGWSCVREGGGAATTSAAPLSVT